MFFLFPLYFSVYILRLHLCITIIYLSISFEVSVSVFLSVAFSFHFYFNFLHFLNLFPITWILLSTHFSFNLEKDWESYLFTVLCNPIDGSPPGSPIPGILQARTLEWVAISFSNA